MQIKNILSFFFCVSSVLLTPLSYGQAANNKPLLQEGKKTLYQRVLTTPTCKLYAKPGDQSGAAQEAFSRYYVYQRTESAGKTWLEVGVDTVGKKIGWLDAACSVEWKMQMSLAFTNPANRTLALFFKDRESIEKIIDAADPALTYAPILDSMAKVGRNPQVLAREPELYVDFRKNFYLLPILQAEEVMSDAGFNVRLLQVASVSRQDPNANPAVSPQAVQSSIKAFSAGVVFVMDSTLSMDPYIERMRAVMKNIYARMEKEKIDDKVKFGLVAFRSALSAVPAIEYNTRIYADPTQVKNGADFFEKIKDLKATKISTPKFDEDPYAGVKEALEKINWNEFGARYIVLVTDAGALDANDPLSATGLDAQAVRELAKEKGVALYVMHLKTPEGAKNHQSAQRQYDTLAFNSIANRPLYYSVDAGRVNVFGETIESLGQSLVTQIKQASMGEVVAGSALTATQSTPATPPAPAGSTAAAIARDSALLGRAMQLAYLGGATNTKAPPFFKAWISDRDLVKQNIPTTEVRVLLTKSQLSDLSSVVTQIVEAANASLVSPTDMFDRLRSVAATMGRDPNDLRQGNAQKLGQMGLLGEYLEGLPYKSDVMGLDEEGWKAMSVAAQTQFMMRLNTKLRQYQSFNADTGSWVSLAKGSDPSEAVYPVPLESLP
ncbi:vWA domain-containing protein [Zwartia sp.]|uniref:vWA domain-containing protein n=1 Tax=Zwartia sp. TaxID=2978004 RepID=UPI003BAF00F6